MNLYDYSARYMEPALGRFTSIDPHAENYYSISPYAYVANNPMRFIDPDGRDFTDRAWDQIIKLSKDISMRMWDNLEKIKNLNNEISAGGLSTKQLRKKRNEINKLQNENRGLVTTRDEFRTLAKSNQVYDIYTDNSLSTSGPVFGMGTNAGGARYNFSNGNFDILLPSSGGLSFLAHELKHAYQFETGNFSSGYMINGSPFYDKHDEIEAYERGELFRGPTGKTTIQSLPSEYDNLQNGPMDATRLPQIILTTPGELQKLVTRTRSAFRVNGITYRF
nr:RHS repeat-associated core domain-containing protein [Dysgonomonas sp. BGC7]